MSSRGSLGRHGHRNVDRDPEVKLIPGIRAVVVALLKSASKMVKVAGLVLLFVLATALFLAEAIGNNPESRPRDTPAGLQGRGKKVVGSR